jgi:ADP-heptose:LPS heptosyltransferase
VAEPFELAAPARSPVTRARAEFAVLHAGSSRGAAYKRYPPERLGDVARELLARAGLRCVVTRGVDAQERELAQRVVAASGGAAELAPELADLADLASLLAAARVVIGADTGPLHLAATVGTPVVQLMGPTDPVENAPWERTPSRQLHAGLACSPCRRGCPEATCMTRLAPAEIAAAAAELIRRSPLEAAAAP